MKKKTLKREIVLSGVGVHSGQDIQLSLKPSDKGCISFVRTDLGNKILPLDPKKIEDVYCTALKHEEWTIQTMEHLLATLYVFGIDSLVVELNGDEVPIMDGSAKPFVEAVQEGGIQELTEQKTGMRILKPHRIHDKEAFVSVSPDPDFRMSYIIEYDHPLIRKQEIHLLINEDIFVREVAPARTYGFLKDVPALRSQGLALGGSLENAVVLDGTGVISGPLRFPDEFVRHKVLDFLGDLSLLGLYVIGHFEAFKAGHRLHHQLVLFLLDHPEYWTYVEAPKRR